MQPLLSRGDLDFEGALPTTEIHRVACWAWTVCTNIMVYNEHLLSSWESGTWVCARYLPSRNSSNKGHRAKSLLSFLQTGFHTWCWNSLLGPSGVSEVTTPGQDPWKLVPGFLRPDSVLCLSWVCTVPFIIINYGYEYDLSSLVSAIETQNWGWSGGSWYTELL